MTEVDLGNTDVLPDACPQMSCDVSCLSSSPCLPPCTNQKEEGGHHDDRKLEQQPKGKLVRSMAVCEESSPLSPEDSTQDSQAHILSSCHDDEKTSCKEEQKENSKDPKKHSLSKEPSMEYTDSTGIDLHQFIVDTLNSNPRDRMMLLKLEQDMIDFITSNSPFKKFPHMSSYHRMLVHRTAAYFGMEHNVDQTGKAVIINRTSSTRIPEQRFLEEIYEEKTEELHQWKAILKRDNSSDDQPRFHPLRERQSKSMEEREEEYQRARERIFNQEPPCAQKNVHTESRAVEEYNPYAETQRRRQLFRGSRDSSGSSWNGSSRQSSTETDCCYSNDPRPWSSTDSDSSYQWSPAPKPRQAANLNRDARGTGSISLYSVSSTCPHPSTPPALEAPAANSAYIMENGIPPGSILVNPQTGQPFLNPDGTPVVYNPPDSQQPIRSQPHLPGPPPQQQQQVVQYSSVSYAPPQMLPVAQSQTYSAVDELSSQFAHATVSCQSTGEAPPLYPPSQGYVYAAPPPPTNPHSYCQPSPQVPMYYYSGQYPTSAPQPCRPLSPSQCIHSQAAQPTAGYPPALGVQSSQSQGQTMLGTYSPMTSHQCGVVQGGVSVSYPQSSGMTSVGVEAGYGCMVPPPCGPAPVPPPSHHGACHPPSCSSLSAQAWSPQY
ncbi:cAMP-regulated phosphoprotein 21 [Polymixia lowei]